MASGISTESLDKASFMLVGLPIHVDMTIGLSRGHDNEGLDRVEVAFAGLSGGQEAGSGRS